MPLERYLVSLRIKNKARLDDLGLEIDSKKEIRRLAVRVITLESVFRSADVKKKMEPRLKVAEPGLTII